MKCWRRLRPAIAEALCLWLACFLPAALAWAQADPAPDTDAERGPTELVERFAAEVEDFSAGFEQDVYNADNELEEASTGTFELLRPDRFAWYYETPYEYEMIADGEWLWQYDVELEQATRHPLSDFADAPAMVLSGGGSVGENFSVRDVASIDGRRWIELVPHERQSEFASAKIAFRDGLPEAIEIVDELSRLTRIEFSDIEINTGLRPRDFEFDPPRGVDVIGADD